MKFNYVGKLYSCTLLTKKLCVDTFSIGTYQTLLFPHSVSYRSEIYEDGCHSMDFIHQIFNSLVDPQIK